MTGRDDNGKPPFDDDEEWIDRDDDTATGPLIDRDDDELFGANPRPREPGFPEEREYPEVPDWDDEVSDPDALPEWDAPLADNDDLNRLAARELDELGDDPYPPEPDDPLPPMSAGVGARGSAQLTDRDLAYRGASDSIDAGDSGDPRMGDAGRQPDHLWSDDNQQDWRDRSSVDSGDDSWSDESEPPADAYRDTDPGYVERGATAAALATGRPSGGTGSRRWPVAMLAIAAIAVVLLAVGGYGVISERSALEAEIRQLQAQLATAISPEQARASRDAQQATEQANIALEAEVSALRSENAELQQTLSDMQSRVEARVEEAEAAEAALPQTPVATAERSPANAPSGPAGDWFVNFGSYAQAGVANRWASRLTVDSGRVVVQDARSRGETIHRVRVVGLADRTTAERVARELESEHNLPKLWVGKD